MKTIAVDFDGVIHGYSRGWQDGSIYDPPVTGELYSSKPKLLRDEIGEPEQWAYQGYLKAACISEVLEEFDLTDMRPWTARRFRITTEVLTTAKPARAKKARG